MSFQQGLSGLNAASKNLDVIGHNIANANTTGMKASRAEFAELYASNLGSSGGVNSGIGVEVNAVSQQFTQGNVSITGNSMDVAINGNGFFQITQPNGTPAYTRDGTFKMTKEGQIVTSDGGTLMGLTAAADGTIPTGGAVGPLVLPAGGEIEAQLTTKIDMRFNLDASAPVATGTAPAALVPPLDTYGTSAIAYNSQGTEVPVSMYFTKTSANTWDMYYAVDGGTPTLAGPLAFDNDGNLSSPSPAKFTPAGLTLPEGDGATRSPALTFNLERATQFGSSKFSVTKATTDGQAPGTLTKINIDESGVIQGVYSNGKSIAAGQIQLATFTNVQGLQPIGGNLWVATSSSGAPTATGVPGTGNLGVLRAGALEDSNVDLTKELVNMMTAQRTYQANAQTIKTQDQLMNTLLNLR
ncbi:flagellar hook protein FlgE [Pseudorhodoferax sp. Leaf267]|uniref:flagellar hook protein FlgE n=1 Tax=Pseudorhodoferax sp. Leaf267 TaxID=1736316 RepID=UPI0006FB3195|nr:flagellar hook protein FlgE [Pseudorhodoferax sp. Leaf267]KQP13752.1 flagellar biosynthesis protein FlgE [Pseudorhodoferax sp. Leaf267]